MLPSIPQTDPRASYLAHREEIDAAITAVLEGGWYILGEQTRAFEREFAAYCDAHEAVGVASGTDALHLALRACGVGPGDAVITVSHTAVATVAAVEMAGALPVLVDIDPERYTLNPTLIDAAVARAAGQGARPRAVVPVHLYGQPADMPAVLEAARRNGLMVVEDCAQAHGALLDGRRLGSWGDIAAFSFYPTKNLGALGDGGAVVTASPEMAARVRLLREYGWSERYVSSIPGFNSRLDELQAAPLRVKLRHLDAGNERRRAIAAIYDECLAGTALRLPAVGAGARHVYHQYAVLHPERDRLRAALREMGIGTLVHYPMPVHLQPAYRGSVPVAGSMEATERTAREVLSLPMFPELTDDAARRVCAAIVEALAAMAASDAVADADVDTGHGAGS